MKTKLFFLLSIFIVLSCKTVVPVDYTKYEVEALDQGIQGTVLMKVYSYDKSVKNAIERAKMNAVQAVLFKGIPGSNISKPMVKDGRMAHEEYFNKFFGLYKVNKKLRRRDRNKDAIDFSRLFNAPYRSYVQVSNDGSLAPGDRVKVGNSYKVGVEVSVNHAQLRKKLEEDGVINGINSGF